MIGAARAVSLRSVVTAPAPTVSAIRETNVVGYAKGPADGGMAFTLIGTDLTGATAVTFGGTAATSFTVVSATTITGVTPAKSAGDHDVTVTTPGGSATLTNGFEALASGSQANFRYLMAGPGNYGQDGSTSAGGDGGAGGEIKEFTGVTLTTGTRAFYAPPGTDGGTTTFNGQTANGGAGAAGGAGATPGSAPGLGSVTSDIDGTSRIYGTGGTGGYFIDDGGDSTFYEAPEPAGTQAVYGRGGRGGQGRSSGVTAGTAAPAPGSGAVFAAYPLVGSRYQTGGVKSIVTIGGVLHVLHTMTGTGNHVNT